MDLTSCRCMKHALFAKASNDTRNSCVWKCSALVNDSGKIMASHSLNYIVHILPAINPGPRAIVRSAISLVVPRFFLARIASTVQQVCISEGHFSLCICHKRNLSRIPDSITFLNTVYLPAENSFHRRLSIINCLTKRNHSPDRSGFLAFQHEQTVSAIGTICELYRWPDRRHLLLLQHFPIHPGRFLDIVYVCHLTVFPLLVSFSSITFSTAFTICFITCAAAEISCHMLSESHLSTISRHVPVKQWQT